MEENDLTIKLLSDSIEDSSKPTITSNSPTESTNLFSLIALGDVDRFEEEIKNCNNIIKIANSSGSTLLQFALKNEQSSICDTILTLVLV